MNETSKYVQLAQATWKMVIAITKRDLLQKHAEDKPKKRPVNT